MKKLAFILVVLFSILPFCSEAQTWRKPITGKLDDCNHNMMVWCHQIVAIVPRDVAQEPLNKPFFDIIRKLAQVTGGTISQGEVPAFKAELPLAAKPFVKATEIPPILELWKTNNEAFNTAFRAYLNKLDPGNVLFELKGEKEGSTITVQLATKRELSPEDPMEYEVALVVTLTNEKGQPVAWPFFVRAAGPWIIFATRVR